MANKKTTENIAADISEKPKKEAVSTNSENDVLKAKIAEQEAQIAAMMEKMQLLLAGVNVNTEKPKKSRSIKFINLVPGSLNLRGNRYYNIANQFESRMIPEGEAKAIVSNMPRTISDGLVYIADKEFIDECELDGVYEEILNDKTLKDLLKCKPEDVCDVYLNACDAQKQIIIDMVSNKKMNGEYIDANILIELGKLCGKDLVNIEPMSEE